MRSLQFTMVFLLIFCFFPVIYSQQSIDDQFYDDGYRKGVYFSSDRYPEATLKKITLYADIVLLGRVKEFSWTKLRPEHRRPYIKVIKIDVVEFIKTPQSYEKKQELTLKFHTLIYAPPVKKDQTILILLCLREIKEFDFKGVLVVGIHLGLFKIIQDKKFGDCVQLDRHFWNGKDSSTLWEKGKPVWTSKKEEWVYKTYVGNYPYLYLPHVYSNLSMEELALMGKDGYQSEIVPLDFLIAMIRMHIGAFEMEQQEKESEEWLKQKEKELEEWKNRNKMKE